MSGKRITTELVVKAVDKYSGKIRNMSGVTGRFATKVRSEMGRLQALRGPLRLIEDFRKQQRVVKASGEAMERARERVRQLQATIKTTRNPTAQMRREFDRARASAARLEEKHQQNRRALSGLQGQMRSAGVNTGNLAGEQRRLTTALGAANTAFARQAERMQRLKIMQDRITAGRKRMDQSLARSANLNFVGSASMATGRRILTGMSAPIMRAVEFESAMSDVRKVVDFESPAAFRTMSADILELSTRIPMAATGLSEIVAAGGQSGIAQEDLTRFAEKAAKIGVAFDISAGKSGESMANIKTALGLTIDETGFLFDAMNYLSNNMASTAPKVLDFMNRTGAAGVGFGFDPIEAMAIGSAMIAAGAQSEVAATSFRKVGGTLVKGAAATSRQRRAYKALGLDATEVAKSMQQDAKSTMLDVFERLQALPDHLRASTMTQLFGEEARAITPLLGNLDLLRDALGLVEGSDYAGSVETEYAVRSKTTANNMQLLRNQTTRLGISIGEVVLPPLNELLAKSQVFIDKLVTWTKEHPKLTKWLVISGVALGGMAVAGGVLLTAAAGLIGTLAVLRFGLVGLGARGAFAAGEIGLLRTGFKGLRGLGRFALATLLTPVRWGAKLIPSVPWARLAGGLRWSSLIKPLAWIGRGALRFILPIGWAVLAGELAWNLLVKPLGWDAYLPSVDWSQIVGSFSWRDGVPVIDWSKFVGAFEWGEKLTSIEWSQFLSPVAWGGWLPSFDWTDVVKGLKWAFFVPTLDIASFVPKLLWYNIVKPLGWDEYLPSIDWQRVVGAFSWDGWLPKVDWPKLISSIDWPDWIPEIDWSSWVSFEWLNYIDPISWARFLSDIPWANWFSFEWSDFLPDWSWDFITEFDLTGLISWPDPPAWLKWMMGEGDQGTAALSVLDAPGSDRLPEQQSQAARVVENAVNSDALPTPERMVKLREDVAFFRAEAEIARDALAANPEFSSGITNPNRVQAKTDLALAEADLKSAQEKLTDTESAAKDLSNALQVISGTEIAPEINAESIDRALEKVARLSAELRSMPSGGGVQTSIGLAREVVPLAGTRATGGPMKAGLPYLAGERGPEPIFSSRAAFVATNLQMQRMQRGAQRVRAAGMAGLAASALAVSGGAVAASGSPSADSGRSGGGKPSVTVNINGTINIPVPADVTDPHAIAEITADLLGQRVEATFAASFSD